jgi:hypothetical protein
MTDLVFLHEPGVLHNLKQRYSSNAIYTYTGSILIAVNPFKALPQLYEKRVMDAYSSGDPSGLAPHVYAIAGAAYRKMRSEGKGQAILVRWGAGGGCAGTGLGSQASGGGTPGCGGGVFRGGRGRGGGRRGSVGGGCAACREQGHMQLWSRINTSALSVCVAYLPRRN